MGGVYRFALKVKGDRAAMISQRTEEGKKDKHYGKRIYYTTTVDDGNAAAF